MNILIVKLSAVGDVIHTLPSLAALRKLYPEAHITWVVEEGASDLLAGHPFLDRVLISRRKTWAGRLRRGKNVRRTLKEMRLFLAELRSRPYDMVIDFHGLLKSAVLVFLSASERRLGYDSLQELSGFFYNEKIFEDMKKHAVLRYLDFVSYLGGDPQNPFFLIPEDDDNRTRVEGLLRESGLDAGQPFLALNPVAYWDTKLWESGKFGELCRRITGELNVPVLITGSRSDGILGEIEAQCPRSINLGGRTGLKDLACLYRRADLLITTDSGPMHLAAAVGTPTIALFGPTDPNRTGPFGENHTVIRKELSCSPCFMKQCDRMDCMKGITVQEVFDSVRNSLRRRNHHGNPERTAGNPGLPEVQGRHHPHGNGGGSPL